MQLVVDPLVCDGHRDRSRYIPKLAFLVVLVVVVRYLLKLLGLFFAAVGAGRVPLRGFDAEWAQPTYHIVRILVVLLALVIAYPYLPGSGSAAFQGLSIFAGLMLSLGASSAMASIIAGYTVTYRRAFRVGDRITVGEFTGEVSEVRLMVTHLRTAKNEEIVVPNSLVLQSHVVNYSKLAKTHGLILHTTVSIGYETPWRQVEAMLLLAAERTAGVLLSEPRPFVLEKSLGDFAVTYELNVYVESAQRHAAALCRPASEHSRRVQRVRRADHDAGLRGRSAAAEGRAARAVVPRAGAARREHAALEHERREGDRPAVVPAQAAVEVALVLDVEAKAEVVVAEADADVIGELPDHATLSDR